MRLCTPGNDPNWTEAANQFPAAIPRTPHEGARPTQHPQGRACGLSWVVVLCRRRNADGSKAGAEDGLAWVGRGGVPR